MKGAYRLQCFGARCSFRWWDATPEFRGLELVGLSHGLREYGGSRIGRREICDFRLGWRELELVGFLLEQREPVD